MFGKAIAEHFFAPGNVIVEDGVNKTEFTCRSFELTGKECTSGNKKFKVTIAAGYYNLKPHLEKCVPNYRALYDNRNLPRNDDIRDYIRVDKKTEHIFKWCELIVSKNLPFSYVEKRLVRESSSLNKISRSSLMRYLDAISFEVQLVLERMLPTRFGLVFDGWDDGSSRNYFGVFCIWWDEKKGKNNVYLLRLCPLIRSDDYGADSHIESITKFLADVGKTWDNVVCLMGDNCSTNKAMADRAHKPFIGCHSHRLNLAVKEFMIPHQAILQKVFFNLHFTG